MFYKSVLVAAFVVAGSLAAHSQDSRSLGDVARQARSQKSGSQPKGAAITNDDLPSGGANGVFGFGSSEKSAEDAPPLASIGRLETAMSKLEAMDGPTVAKLVLQGSDADFPGKNAWEQRLFAAKALYVSQGRKIVESAKQFMASAQTIKDSHATLDDPRVKEMNDKLKSLVQAAIQADSSFEAVVLEGRDLAHPVPAH